MSNPLCDHYGDCDCDNAPHNQPKKTLDISNFGFSWRNPPEMLCFVTQGVLNQLTGEGDDQDGTVINMGINMGRAWTDEKKREVIEQIYTAWTSGNGMRQQRLGQLISNAVHPRDIFHIEDDKLVNLINDFVKDKT